MTVKIKSGDAVKVMVGLYKGMPGKVVEAHPLTPPSPDRIYSVLVQFGSGYRVRYWNSELDWFPQDAA